MPSQKSDRLCICLIGLSILSLSTILIFDFGIFPTVSYFLFFISDIFKPFYSLHHPFPVTILTSILSHYHSATFLHKYDFRYLSMYVRQCSLDIQQELYRCISGYDMLQVNLMAEFTQCFYRVLFTQSLAGVCTSLFVLSIFAIVLSCHSIYGI